MEIIKWFGFNTIPIGIIISIFLLIYGKIKHICKCQYKNVQF